jgi:cytochrome b subunit of formate dehydrogenase
MKTKIFVILFLILILTGCAIFAGSDFRSGRIAKKITGTWQDPEGCTYKFVTITDSVHIISIVDSDRETFDILDVNWTNGVLSWKYRVPSTNYVVSMKTTSITENTMFCRWQNEFSDGTEILRKISDKID